MSGLETLPPDQRAVLQLILAQGRGYAELAGLLQIEERAVRERAQAGLEALAGAPAPDPRLADYLLGQQDEGERIVTLAQLGESADACRWAAGVREQLVPLAHGPIPAVPEPAASNGATREERPRPEPVATAPAPPPPPPPQTRPTATPRPTPSRRGGAVVLAIAAAAVVALAVVLIGGDDDEPTTAASTPRTTQTTTTPQQQLPLAQVNLVATEAGGRAAGVGFVQQIQGGLAIAVQAQDVPPNGADDIYALWLQGPAGARLLGYLQNQVGESGTFSVSARLPRNVRRFGTVLVTREAAEGEPATTPGEAILSGALDLPAR